MQLFLSTPGMLLLIQFFMAEEKAFTVQHHLTEFFLKDLLLKDYPVNRDNLKSGIVCIVGKDGYRSVVSYSELFNRNDQQEFMLIKTRPEEDGGLFRIFAAC